MIWIPISALYGYIEITTMPSRIDGDELVLRTRHRTFDGSGNVTRDEIFEGARVQGGREHWHLLP